MVDVSSCFIPVSRISISTISLISTIGLWNHKRAIATLKTKEAPLEDMVGSHIFT